MHAKLGLTGPQRLALRLVGSFPGLAPSELAELLHVDRGTLTGIVERLVAKRLVERRPDPEDGRRATLTLTSAGQRLNREVSGTVEAQVRQAISGLAPAKVAAAGEVLEALAAHLLRAKDLGARSARRNAARE